MSSLPVACDTPDRFPSRLKLRTSHQPLTLDVLRPDAYSAAYSLVVDAARRGENVGVDEYPSLDHFVELLGHSNIALTASTVGKPVDVKCLLVVTPCQYARSIRPTLCTVAIWTAAELSKREIMGELATWGVQIAAALPEAYSACVVDVFVTCIDRVMAFRDSGFLITACIPNAGKLTRMDQYIASYIMYKELPNDVTCFNNDNSTQTNESSASELPDFEPTLLPTNFNIPPQFTLNDGTSITIREMRRDEIEPFYAALKVAMADGEGYGADEIPNIDYFRRYYVHNFKNIVYTLTSSGAVICYANSGPSAFSRSTSSGIVDGNMIMAPEFRGKGWYVEMAIRHVQLADRMHAVSVQGDTAICRLASVVGGMKIGYIPNGILPKGIYLNGKGWVDLILYSMLVTKNKSTTEIMSKM